MSSQEPSINAHMVYRALSRPITYLGVDFVWFGVEITVVILAFIWTKMLWTPLLVIPLHLIGWVLVKIDTHIFAILNVKSKIGQVKYHRIFGGQSYGED